MKTELVNEFSNRVHLELYLARKKHDPVHSSHEGYSVILEELDEFWDECRKRSEERDPEAMLAELVQIAAMAQRVAEDVVYPQLKQP